MTDTLAPIVLFAFSRPEHTRQTLEALAANARADESDLIVYSDAARTDAEAGQVRAVRSVIQAARGFRSVHVVERETNYGLARNIVEGVTEVCNRHGRVIVLEDDIVTSPGFLSFMNAALDRYVDDPRAWHVSGWNYPIDPSGLDDAFFWRVMNCWGWATWADRWRHFRKDPQALVDSWGREKVRRFNLDGAHDFWTQVRENRRGERNTWAVFWYATIFDNGGLCLNPARSFVRNIGHDGSGENCDGSDPFTPVPLGNACGDLPERLEESRAATQRIKAFYDRMRPPLGIRMIRYVANLIPGVRALRP